MLRRIDRTVSLTGQERFVAGDGSRADDQATLVDIFRDGRARTTILMWLACVCSMGSIALMGFWLPSFFYQMAGIPIQRFAIYSMISFVGSLAGTLVMGWFMDRFRPLRVITVCYLGLALATLCLGLVPFEAAPFIIVLVLFNLCQTGGQTGLNTLLTQIYPASMRATGIGWAGGAGRLGGVVIPLFGGFAVGRHFSLQLTMTTVAILPLAVAILVSFARQERDLAAGERIGAVR